MKIQNKLLIFLILFIFITAVPSFAKDQPWTKKNGKFISSDGSVIKGAQKKGIDVSEWQHELDWPEIKDSDIEFAILRCGYGQDRETQDDKMFKVNADACEELSIPFGVYLYSYATSVEAAKSEARHVLRLIKDYDLSYPVYYDMEDKSQIMLPPDLLGDIAEAFCNTIIKAGYEAGIYSNTNTFNTKLWDLRFNNPKWHKWIAHYAPKCTYPGTFNMWQATDKGRIKGIDQDLDFNFLFGNVKRDTDAPSEWAVPYINRAIARGLLPIELRHHYKEKINRIEFCKLSYNLLKKFNLVGKPKGKSPFKDTNAPEIVALYENKIIKGKSPTEFYPEDNIKREELAIILSNILSLSDKDEKVYGDHKYKDQEEISDWALKAVNEMKYFDIMKGNDKNEFCPKDNTSKQEAIITILSMYDIIR